MANRFEKYGRSSTPAPAPAPAEMPFGVTDSPAPAKGGNRFEVYGRGQPAAAPTVADEPLWGMSPEMEVAASVGSAVAAEPMTGIYGGMASLLELANEDPSLENVVGFMDETREDMTYRPRAPEAQGAMRGIGNAMEPVAQAMEYAEQGLGNATLEATGSPELAAIAHTLPTAALEALGVFNYAPRSLRDKYAETVESGAAAMEQGGASTGVDQPAPYMKPIPEHHLPDVSNNVAPFEQQVASQELFAEQGVSPAGASRIKGDVKSQQEEGWLFQKTDSPEADQYRQNIFIENEQVKARYENLAKTLGLPENAGASTKDALDGIQSSMASERVRAYENLAEMVDDDGVKSFPVHKEPIMDAVANVRRYGLEPADENALARLLMRFGFADESISVPKSGLDMVFGNDPVTPVNLGNLEDFRQEINRILPADSTSSKVKAARKHLISAVDSMYDDVGDRVDTDSMAAAIREQVKKARELRKKEADTVEAKDLVQNLTEYKPGTATPMVEASEVAAKIKRTPKLTQVDKMVKLLQTTPEGRQALANLQSAAILDLLNVSLRKGTLLGSMRTEYFSPFRYTKALDGWGRIKLKTLFKSHPEVYKTLQRMEDLNKRRVTGAESQQRGSIPPHLVNRLYSMATRLPVMVGTAIEKVGGTDADRATAVASKNAQRIQPVKEDIDKYLITNTPRLAAALGLGAAPQVSETINEEYNNQAGD